MGDVLYATPRRFAYALAYRTLGIVGVNIIHAALVGTNCVLQLNSDTQADVWVIDAVMSGKFPGVHRKPLGIFADQFRTKWHAWMPDLRNEERAQMIRVAERWDGIARWHWYYYKNPEKRLFHCLGNSDHLSSLFITE